MLVVHEMFTSLEGEATYAGQPTAFVRFAGCSINCTGCDTPESHSQQYGYKYSPEEIFEAVVELTANEHPIKHVSLTGGNPVEQDENLLIELITLLKERYFVRIEHPGVFLKNDMRIISHANFISFDLKPPSMYLYTKEHPVTEAIANINKWPSGNQVKIVIKDEVDLHFAKTCAELVNTVVYCQPFNNDLQIAGMITRMIPGYFPPNTRLGLQIHKILNIE